MLVTILLTAGALLLVAALATAALVWRRPLAAYGRLSRLALRRAGLRRSRVAASVGEQTAFVGGHGPTVILLHGAGDQAGTWAPTVPALLSRWRVVALDLPGHGKSEPTSGPLSVGTVVEGVAEALDALVAEEPWTIVGNSLGAWVAMLLAARRPGRVGRLVLENGGALRSDVDPSIFTPVTREQARTTLEALTGADVAWVPGFVLDDLVRVCRHGPIGRMAQTAGDIDHYVLDGRLGEIAAPADLLWGADDRVFPLEYAERLKRQLPASRLTVLAGCGHVPHRTRPRRFNQALLGILDAEAPEVSRASR